MLMLNVDTLRLKQNDRHFADDIFKCIFFNENRYVMIQISLYFVPKGPNDDKPSTELIVVLVTDAFMRYSTMTCDVIKWKHFPRYWLSVRGIHRSPVNSLHKGQWHGALMFSLIGAWMNGWVNNREAGDWRRLRAHYAVTVMRHYGSSCKASVKTFVLNSLLEYGRPDNDHRKRKDFFHDICCHKCTSWRKT